MLRADLRRMREQLGLTQNEAAKRLGLSQTYVSLLEKRRRPLTPGLARRFVRALRVSPTLLPLSQQGVCRKTSATQLARDLASLGYPGFAYLRKGRERNPSEVLLCALAKNDLEARLAEALPWLLLQYSDMDFDWLVREAKLQNLTNRLGFVASLAHDSLQGSGPSYESRKKALSMMLDVLGKARLAEEQTFGQSSVSEAEKNWLREHRPDAARHWNLLTDWRPEFLQYAKYADQK